MFTSTICLSIYVSKSWGCWLFFNYLMGKIKYFRWLCQSTTQVKHTIAKKKNITMTKYKNTNHLTIFKSTLALAFFNSSLFWWRHLLKKHSQDHLKFKADPVNSVWRNLKRNENQNNRKEKKNWQNNFCCLT